jgi:hypothetical protein
MPRIRWTNLPDAIRKHLLLRLKDRQIAEEDLLSSSSGVNPSLRLPRDLGTRTSAPSGSAERDSTPRRSCSEVRRPEVGSSDLGTLAAQRRRLPHSDIATPLLFAEGCREAREERVEFILRPPLPSGLGRVRSRPLWRLPLARDGLPPASRVEQVFAFDVRLRHLREALGVGEGALVRLTPPPDQPANAYANAAPKA